MKALNLEAFTGRGAAQYIEEELKVEFQENQELVTVLMYFPRPARCRWPSSKAIIDSYMEEIVYAEQTASAAMGRRHDHGADQGVRHAQEQTGSTSSSRIPATMDPQTLMFHIGELASEHPRSRNAAAAIFADKSRRQGGPGQSRRAKMNSMKELRHSSRPR